eukprot:gene12016-12106_t
MNDVASSHLAIESDMLSQVPPHEDGMLLLPASGLFDAGWYLKRNADIATGGADPLEHFLNQGWKEGRQPNPYFDVEFYLANNPDVVAAGPNPLLHYILAGEAEGRLPSPLFDLGWYAAHHSLPMGTSPLAHFLAHRYSGTVSPMPEFDPVFYLNAYRDIAAAGIDPFEHYIRYGFREGRDPSAGFDSKFYISRYLGGELDQNPLLHFRQWRHALRLHTMQPADEASVFDQVRKNTRPGPDFEEFQPLPRGAQRQAKVLAYYLPQFHAVAENDRWWGRGFTEWTAIARGMPRFPGHYQPRIPRDLGHYNLSDTETMRRQIALARDAGVFGFVQYFYWFNQRRLLEKPLEAFLADASLDFPFCLMWANENWTRRWDGSDNEILISQDWDAADEPALLACFARHFADPRYIRIAGRPVLMIYRAGLIPDCRLTLARWRAIFRIEHGCEPVMVMAQSFGETDPRDFGFDGAIEFPPHKLTDGLRTRNQEIRVTDCAARGHIYAFDDLIAASLAEPAPAFPLIKTALPDWDNDARREGLGMTLTGASPAKYQAWLEALVDRSAEHSFLGERIVCVNAWNEWAEGAYLEPDVHFGAAYLNATGRAAARLAPVGQRETVLLVGHDAFAAGAQMLLLNVGRQMIAAHGVAVEFLLLGDGTLRPDYAAVAPTHVAISRKGQSEAIGACARRGVRQALVNTSVAARVIPLLRRAGIEAILLVHELPRVMAEYKMLPGLRAGAAEARRVIFPATCVHDAFPDHAALGERARVLPQGIYRKVMFDPFARQRLRRTLNMHDGQVLVLGCGHGDMRKGFDLFLQVARMVRKQNAPVHFCWVGSVDPALAAYLAPEIELAMAHGMFHLPGFQEDMSPWLSAADAFALPSREDPFPSVALEAMACGIGVVAFEGAGGISELVRHEDCGMVVPMSDVSAFAQAAMALALPEAAAVRAKRGAAAAARFDFPFYVAELLAELRASGPRISVVVPSHNYARFLPERLASIFGQTHPVEEVIVLDDASTDDSVAVAEACAQDWRRSIGLEVRAENGGNVFLQWRRAAQCARGDFIWIAEADDGAEPELLARLSRLLAAHPDIDLAFCDSRTIDAGGQTMASSYKDYYRTAGAGSGLSLDQDGVFDAGSFLKALLAERNTILNASAVVFRTEALRAALARCGDELASWQVAGDWRLYIDLLAHSSGRVGYLAAPLNAHRRHGASATASLKRPEMLAEIARMHAVVNAILPPDRAREARQETYRRSLEMEGRAENVVVMRPAYAHRA